MGSDVSPLFDATPDEIRLMNAISAAIIESRSPEDRVLFRTRYRAARAAVDVLRERDARAAEVRTP